MTRILGIDPGSRVTGFGIIDLNGNHADHVSHGCIKVKGNTLIEKLYHIFDGIDNTIKHYHPEEVAIEKVFMHKNADSALKLGQARGAAITACAIHELKFFEYAANRIKQATVGKGHADKTQVQHMVRVLLCLQQQRIAEDAADALAVAICHHHYRGTLARIQQIEQMTSTERST